MPGEEGDQEPEINHNEERQAGYHGRLPCLQHQGIPHRQGVAKHNQELQLRAALKVTPGWIWHKEVGAPASRILELCELCPDAPGFFNL